VLGFGSYQTAPAWLHKLRRAIMLASRELLAGAVEIDETYIGRARGQARARSRIARPQEMPAQLGRSMSRRIPGANIPTDVHVRSTARLMTAPASAPGVEVSAHRQPPEIAGPLLDRAWALGQAGSILGRATLTVPKRRRRLGLRNAQSTPHALLGCLGVETPWALDHRHSPS
jgi:hypothetical protein